MKIFFYKIHSTLALEIQSLLEKTSAKKGITPFIVRAKHSIYFFLKKILIGTPFKSKFSRS